MSDQARLCQELQALTLAVRDLTQVTQTQDLVEKRREEKGTLCLPGAPPDFLKGAQCTSSLKRVLFAACKKTSLFLEGGH